MHSRTHFWALREYILGRPENVNNHGCTPGNTGWSQTCTPKIFECNLSFIDMVSTALVKYVGQIQPVLALTHPWLFFSPRSVLPEVFSKIVVEPSYELEPQFLGFCVKSVELLMPAKFHSDTRSRLTLSSSGTNHADDSGSTWFRPFSVHISYGAILQPRASIFGILRQSVDLLMPTKFHSHPLTRSWLTLSSSGTGLCWWRRECTVRPFPVKFPRCRVSLTGNDLIWYSYFSVIYFYSQLESSDFLKCTWKCPARCEEKACT